MPKSTAPVRLWREKQVLLLLLNLPFIVLSSQREREREKRRRRRTKAGMERREGGSRRI